MRKRKKFCKRTAHIDVTSIEGGREKFVEDVSMKKKKRDTPLLGGR